MVKLRTIPLDHRRALRVTLNVNGTLLGGNTRASQMRSAVSHFYRARNCRSVRIFIAPAIVVLNSRRDRKTAVVDHVHCHDAGLDIVDTIGSFSCGLGH